MKKINIVVLALLGMGMQSCDEMTDTKSDTQSRTDLKLESDIMTPEVLWSMGRIGEYAVSPDGKMICYGVTHYSVEQNNSSTELYVMNTDGSGLYRVGGQKGNEYNPRWTPDGKRIVYLAATENGTMQVFEMNPDGTQRTPISDFGSDISGFEFSPNGKHIVFSSEVKIKDNVADIYPDLDKSSGRINNDLMYRHWDIWVDTYSHLFVADIINGKIVNPVDIMKGEPWESPVRPWGGMEQLKWSPDSKAVVYTARKLVGKEYALSTNTDIYAYDLESKATRNISKGMMGYDNNPSFSTSGRYLAWESMERDGYESDKQRLMVIDFNDNKITDYSIDFDQNSNSLRWSADDSKIYFISDRNATEQIYVLDIESRQISKVTEGQHDYVSLEYVSNDCLIAGRQSMSHATELYTVNPQTGEQTQISHINDNIFNQLCMGNVEERWIKTTDDKEMLTWVIYPPHFDRNKKYPALLYCEGGPQSTVNQFWSYRWNFQMMAANGYIIVAPNRRGLPGFGKEWLEEISGDYGGQCMKDYLRAIDEVSKEPFIDENRLGAVGASFGGYSVYWLAGHHDGRFKAFIAHDGMFNLEAQYLETEEMWFVNWDLGGPFWEKDNATAQRSYANSPHKFVDKWDTPILVIHGGLDYRICFTQGMQAYNAAVLRGIPAEFLYFPDENHWVLKPQNGILWQRRFRNWLDKYLK